jgi:hypothetical protein
MKAAREMPLQPSWHPRRYVRRRSRALEDAVTSMRCLNRLRLVRQAAETTPGAEEFCARFDAIEQARAVPGTA